MLVAATDKGLCSVKLGDDAKRLERLLAEEFSAAEIVPSDLQDLKAKILAFIEGEASLARLPLDIRGTVFQRRVWDELRRIPRGETRTYQQIARAIGATDWEGARDVGVAMGSNRMPIVIPCHRVLAAGGKLGGFSAYGGAKTKQKLLALEGVRLDDGPPRLPGL